MAIDINITDEKENTMLKRKELTVQVSHPGETTPSRATLQGMIAKLTDAQPEYTEIREVRSGTGRAASKVRARIWEDKEIGLYAGGDSGEDDETADQNAEDDEDEAGDEESETEEEEEPETEEQEDTEETDEEAEDESPDTEEEETDEDDPDEE